MKYVSGECNEKKWRVHNHEHEGSIATDSRLNSFILHSYHGCLPGVISTADLSVLNAIKSAFEPLHSPLTVQYLQHTSSGWVRSASVSSPRPAPSPPS